MKVFIDFSTIKAAKRNDLSNPITAAFHSIAQGIVSSDFHTLVKTADEADVVFVFGSITKRKPDTERAISISNHRANKKKILSLDSALFSTYIRRHLNSSETNFFRIGLHDCTGTGDFLNEGSKKTRYSWLKKTFNFTEKDPQCDNTKPIMFALQSEKGWMYDNTEPYFVWAKNTIAKIRERTDRLILLKPHPNTDRYPVEWIASGYSNVQILGQDKTRRDIIDDLANVGALITHSSSAACESYVEGIPTFALDKRCVVYKACQHDLTNINSLEKINWSKRKQILNNWAFTSWHVDELKNPHLIHYYLEKVKQKCTTH